MSITWHLIPFRDLSLDQLYQLLQLRTEVFVVEQYCPYQDLDGKDQQSWHLMGFHEQHLAAYARILPPGISYSEASIGRILTSKDFRGQGLGQALMREALAHIAVLFGSDAAVRISAQLYLLEFYQSFGFLATQKKYLEDGIPHIEMLRGNPQTL